MADRVFLFPEVDMIKKVLVAAVMVVVLSSCLPALSTPMYQIHHRNGHQNTWTSSDCLEAMETKELGVALMTFIQERKVITTSKAARSFLTWLGTGTELMIRKMNEAVAVRCKGA
jgi:hypothetical protein